MTNNRQGKVYRTEEQIKEALGAGYRAIEDKYQYFLEHPKEASEEFKGSINTWQDDPEKHKNHYVNNAKEILTIEIELSKEDNFESLPKIKDLSEHHTINALAMAGLNEVITSLNLAPEKSVERVR